MAKQTFGTGVELFSAVGQGTPNLTDLQTNDYNWTISVKTASYVPVAGDVGTRLVMNAAGATTLTLNTALFAAGDLVAFVNIGAGSCTLTAGTCAITSLGSLVVPQHGGGFLWFYSTSVAEWFPSAGSGGGLVFLTGGSFTTSSGVSLPANTFSATYRNYLLRINLTANTADSNAINWRGRTAGVDNSNALYAYALGGHQFDSGAAIAAGNGVTQTSARLTLSMSPFTTCGIDAIIFAPQLTSPTSFVVSATGRGTGVGQGALRGGGYFDATTSFDALTFYPATASSITGTYEVYGYAIA